MDKNTLRATIISQKKETKKILKQEKIIERELQKETEKQLKNNLIKITTGVRRCGKSTLALQTLQDKEHAYINFDDERLYKITTKDLDTILETLYEVYGNFKYLLLDEIQNIPGWELYANRLQRQGLNLIVTGSNAKLLSKELATHLTGRHITLELYPFSFREYLSYHKISPQKEDLQIAEGIGKIKKHLRDYIEKGGFPETYKIKDNTRYLKDLYNSIINQDIISRYNIKYANTLREIISYTISNYASPITYKKIKNIFDIKSQHTIKNYLYYAEESYLITQSLQYTHKIKEQTRLPKKIYAIDTGLIKAIGFKASENTGRLMENLIAIELQRKKTQNPLLEIYHWRDYQKREVDFAVKEGLKVKELIQACYDIEDPKTKEREEKALIKAGKELRCKNLKIITWDHEETGRIEYIPLWKWLLQPTGFVPATEENVVPNPTN
ncbi:MAG: ATP-binding protein [Candidatus Altiarchaeota archaeon]|nr:ATP-binding protein [Candidatus Altiarchaeota archaeon]